MRERMNHDRRRFVGAVVMTLGASQLGLIGSAKSLLATEDDLPSLTGATGWLNSQPLTRADLRGKVALIDFWTYSCINWRRTVPYLRAWVEKYKDHGLVVIGVHTPEFTFEQSADNVRWARNEMRIDYPVALDAKYAVWRAFQNEYWPALYLIDAQGNVRYQKFGEGDYAKSEMAIQQLLIRSGASGFDRGLISVEGTGVEAAADWANLKSGENYTGYERTENFASPGGQVRDRPHAYALPARLKLNHWALAGNWTAKRDALVLNAGNGRIAYQFHARDLHVVMGPSAQGTPVRFRTLIDGEAPSSAHGVDVDAQGIGMVTKARLYQLIRQPNPVAERTLEIEFLDPGVEVFDFTFG
jgi:thiol-disulfide isomerase/thioredoxin